MKKEAQTAGETAQHTPGPWKAHPLPNGFVVDGDMDGVPRDVAYVNSRLPHAAATAKLIAKSPEIHALALHILAVHDDAYLADHPEWLEIVAEAREATTP